MHYYLQLSQKAQQLKLANTCRCPHTKRSADKAMEKLLSATKNKGGNYAMNLKQPTHKNISFSCCGYENIFCRRCNKQQKNQPYSGCIIFINQIQNYY